MEYNLRQWSMNDLQSLVKYGCNEKISDYMSDGFPKNKDQWKKFLTLAISNENILYRAIEIGGEAVGSIGISPNTDIKRKNAELGYWLGEPFWGRGIMSRAIQEITHEAFSVFDITRIFALPFSTNISSHKALSNAGYKLEARLEKTVYKNGEFLDEFIFSFRKDMLASR